MIITGKKMPFLLLNIGIFVFRKFEKKVGKGNKKYFIFILTDFHEKTLNCVFLPGLLLIFSCTDKCPYREYLWFGKWSACLRMSQYYSDT